MLLKYIILPNYSEKKQVVTADRTVYFYSLFPINIIT